MVGVLDGLDLSEKMIALAAAKKIYRNLHAGNIVNFLKTTRKRYDFFLAGDVFAYVGDLAQTFALLRKCARQPEDLAQKGKRQLGSRGSLVSAVDR
jgi:predicted TPR repeat methyltransferase